MRLTVLMPTRNRADLARRGIASVLAAGTRLVTLVVSDNSSDPAEARALESYCRSIDDARLHYVRPPGSMPMAEHWAWALDVALGKSDATHVTVLQDRMQFLPGAIDCIGAIAEAAPQRVLAYLMDYVDDYRTPVRVIQREWCGALFEVPSAFILAKVSRAEIWFRALPRLINCVVPVSVIAEIAARFGTICGPLAPDYGFAFRCLALVDAVSYVDRPCLVQYGLHRSTGMNYSRGATAPDTVDFERQAGAPLNSAAPVPEIRSGVNAVVHEYCEVRSEGVASFPAVDRPRYLERLAEDVRLIEDARARGAQFALLRAAGWQGEPPATRGMAGLLARARGGDIPRRVKRLAAGHLTQPVWMALDRLGVHPPADQRFHFASLDDALAYMVRRPRPRRATCTHLRGMVPGV